MSRMKKWGLLAVLLLSLFVFTACEELPPEIDTTHIPYANSRTAAVFSGLRNGRFKITYTSDIWWKVIRGEIYADLGSNRVQTHAVRNSYDFYQREEGMTCYTLDVNEKTYTEEMSSGEGMLHVAKILTTGGSGTVTLTRKMIDGCWYENCEQLYDGDQLVATCIFDGEGLKYIRTTLMGNKVDLRIDSMSSSFDSGEMNIAGFPEQYTKVAELKRVKELQERY